MKEQLNNLIENFEEYMMRTAKNKIFALALIILGWATVFILEDGTFLLFTVLIGLALFFAKDDIFEME